MDKETLNKRINAGNFVETNGSIMRTLNVLATKYSRLKDNVTINEIWYRGKAYELQQLYHSLRLDISQAGFWSQVGYSDNMRKIHSGLPPDLNSPLKIPMKSRSFLDLLYMGVV